MPAYVVLRDRRRAAGSLRTRDLELETRALARPEPAVEAEIVAKTLASPRAAFSADSLGLTHRGLGVATPP